MTPSNTLNPEIRMYLNIYNVIQLCEIHIS